MNESPNPHRSRRNARPVSEGALSVCTIKLVGVLSIMKMSKPTRRVRPSALLALTVTMTLWAGAFVGIRYATEYFSPGALALGRLASGAVVLLTIMLFVRGPRIPARAWPGLIVAGVFWFGLYMFALNAGETLVDSATAALVVGIGPVLVVLVGSFYVKERPAVRLIVGLVIAVGGTALAAVGQDHSTGSAVGILLCVLAAVGFAIGSTAQKPSLAYATPLQATAIGCTVGAVACLPFAPDLVAEAVVAPASALVVTVLLGVLPTALAFFTWAYAMKRAPASVLATSTYVVPALTLLFAWVTLGQIPAPWALAGGMVTLVGVAVATVPTRRRRRPPITSE